MWPPSLEAGAAPAENPVRHVRGQIAVKIGVERLDSGEIKIGLLGAQESQNRDPQQQVTDRSGVDAVTRPRDPGMVVVDVGGKKISAMELRQDRSRVTQASTNRA